MEVERGSPRIGLRQEVYSTNKNLRFPDQVHLEKIRSKLWCGREYGQAAVMVGAGLGRNAETRVPNRPAIPLWSDLGKAMYCTLYAQAEPMASPSPSDTLRLASEYESTFGRQALDELLIGSISDGNYYPGQLHRLLLTLPWSDVFTTNYDTLLERSVTDIRDRKYDVIRTVQDIPCSMKPRIVKLHGSFPSNRPFIVTEEDYRTYPRCFAPFVNLVQQALMENVFCLIGFSANDPNFLYWSGWVRDNLGSATLPMYLCGLLGLTAPQRKLLEDRKIVPVDLSPLFAECHSLSSAQKHRYATEWLLLYLAYGRMPDVREWPFAVIPDMPKPSPEFPVLPPSQDTSVTEAQSSSQDDSDKKDLRRIKDKWGNSRKTYPGWVVCPRTNRSNLWFETVSQLESALESLETLPVPDNLLLAYELNWRLERLLVPLFKDWATRLDKLVKTYNPFPNVLTLSEAKVTPKEGQYRDLDWSRLSEEWVGLLFALARRCREDSETEDFDKYMGTLRKLAPHSEEWRARWHYEMCMFQLGRLDYSSTRKALKEWPTNPGLPFWEARRAAILYEIGDIDEADRISGMSLSAIRASLRAYEADFGTLSQEGWVMVLRTAVHNAMFRVDQHERGMYSHRWEQLNAHKCNPWFDIDMLEETLKTPVPYPRTVRRVKRGFDPHTEVESFQFTSILQSPSYLSGFMFLRMLEEGCLPSSAFKDSSCRAARWVSPFSSLWGMTTLVRSATRSEIDDWFTRAFVASLPGSQAETMVGLLIAAEYQLIEQLKTRTKSNAFPREALLSDRLDMNSEVLSRLGIRQPAANHELIDLCLVVYQEPLFRENPSLHKAVEVLFHRTIDSLDEAEITSCLPELLCLPIPSEKGFDARIPEWWPEPFHYISLAKRAGTTAKQSLGSTVQWLLGVVSQGREDARERAILRLCAAFFAGYLTKEEQRSFGTALWSRTSDLTGLPANFPVQLYALLLLPQPEERLAENRLRRYWCSQTLKTVINQSPGQGGGAVSMTGLSADHSLYALFRATRPLPCTDESDRQLIDWSEEEAENLIRRVSQWWNDQKPYYSSVGSIDSLAPQSAKREFLYLEAVLARLIPRLANARETVRSEILSFIEDLNNHSIPTYFAHPAAIILGEDASQVATNLKGGLNSPLPEYIRSAAGGIAEWFRLASAEIVSQPPHNLLRELVSRIVARKQPGLDSVIESLTLILACYPSVVTRDLLDDLCVGLGYLLDETRPDQNTLNAALDTPEVIRFVDKPHYRALAASLARTLSLEFRRLKETPPDVLSKWSSEASHDPMPEVRKAWQSPRV